MTRKSIVFYSFTHSSVSDKVRLADGSSTATSDLSATSSDSTKSERSKDKGYMSSASDSVFNVEPMFEQHIAPDWEVMLAPFRKDSSTSEEEQGSQNESEDDPLKDESFIDESPDLEEMEEGTQATEDELVEVELGTAEDHRPTFISALLSEKRKRGSYSASQAV